MASITARLPGGISVVGTDDSGNGVQYTVRLNNGTVVGPLSGADFTNLSSNSLTLPPPAYFALSLNGRELAKSFDPADIQYGSEIVLNGFSIQNYMERNLAVTPVDSITDPAVEPDPQGNDITDEPPLPDPSEYDEFAGVDEAIAQQEQIAINTSGLPVVAEDGSVAQGVLINPETGETYYTDPPAVNPNEYDEFAGVDEAIAQQKQIDYNTQGLPVYAEDGSIAQGIAINPETGETYYTGTEAPYSEGSSQGLSGATYIAESTATAQDNANFSAFADWRVRLTLANDAQYLYRAPQPGILAPLATTDGVVFPYTPIIAVSYAANYEPTTITHSNYKIFQYAHSSVDNISITCDFTAQDTYEANYMLAVIHFFRSMTKMFYGQDEFPRNGTPPPLCYLFGLGGFQFEAHPLAITGFTYNLPNDVDYIRTTTTISSKATYGTLAVSGNGRLPTGILPGGIAAPAEFDNDGEGFKPSYVPTKIQLAITCIPVMSRNAISNRFSLRDYATGSLLQGTQNPGGGIW